MRPRRRRRRKHRGRRRFRRGIYLLPSLLTTGNLFAGYYSVIATLQGDYRPAALAIGIAFVLDGLDGRIARMTNTQTDFGHAYDSLADVITFGLAPAVLVFSWGLWDLGRVGWLASFFLVVCAAMRLARFTSESSADRRFFVGFPTPPAAGLLAALAFYWPARVDSLVAARTLLGIVIVVALLMVSTVRYRSFKDVDLHQRQSQAAVVIVAVIIALIALDPENVLLLLAVGYVLSGPIERAARRLRRARVEDSGERTEQSTSSRGPGGADQPHRS